MRWLWIDRIVQLVPRERAIAIKAVSAAEEQMHDLMPDYPNYPHSLIIEGMAQTAGILVCEASNYREKVILAKIGRATFHRLVGAGTILRFEATIEQLNDTGASITGKVTAGDELVADIELMFSHIDQNMGGQKFPDDNFVFTDEFARLLKDHEAPVDLTL